MLDGHLIVRDAAVAVSFGRTGDLYITYKIKMPTKINDEARALLEQAAAAGGL